MDLDLLLSRSNLPRARFDAVLKALPSVSREGPWIAGGALRRLVTGVPLDGSDFDFFFRDEFQRDAFEGALKAAGAKRLGKTAHNSTWSLAVDGKPARIQSVHIAYYGSASEVIDSFDFTICQLGYDGEKLHCGEFALWDIARKKLAVNKITYAVSSVRRFLKYSQQGYTVCSGAILKTLEAVIADPEIVRADLEYID